jgi:hypothetical protein
VAYDKWSGWTTEEIAASLPPGTTTRDVRRLVRRLGLKLRPRLADGVKVLYDDDRNALIDWASHNLALWKR